MSENIRKEIEKELNGLKNNLDKFTTAVEIFDEAKKLASEAGQQISQTTKENKEILDSSSSALTKLLKEQSAHIELFEETLTKLTELQQKISESDIPKNLDQINSTIEKSKTDNQSSFEQTTGKLEKIVNLVEENDKTLSKSIKQLIDSLLDKITSRFDSIGKDLKDESGKINEELASVVQKNTWIVDHISSFEQNVESNHKESMKWQATQMTDLNVKFTKQIQTLKNEAIFHQKFIYGGIALILVLQLVMLYFISQVI